MYVVIRCPRCGELMLANTDNRTRSCQRCNHRSEIRTLRIIGKAETASEAVILMKTIKEKEAGGDSFIPGFKRLNP